MLADILKINHIFDIENIKMPVINDKICSIINSIKKLYNKRDKVVTEHYNLENFIYLYVFMIDTLTKRISIIKSTKSKKDIIRDKRLYSINETNKTMYDELIDIMNQKVLMSETTIENLFVEDD
jgi:hypothetical protein